MKTKEELNAPKKEADPLNKTLTELTAEELEQANGGLSFEGSLALIEKLEEMTEKGKLSWSEYMSKYAAVMQGDDLIIKDWLRSKIPLDTDWYWLYYFYLTLH